MRKRTLTALCGLILCALLCGCGDADRGVVAIGLEEDEETAGEDVTVQVQTAVSVQTAAPEIRVYVCGAVKLPGVVSLPEGSRAEDALKAAGGLAEHASPDYINLAERVTDGQRLYFPAAEEAEALSEQEAALKQEDGLIDINSADVSALCTLPGIGEARARDIVAYREANGAFESCEEIMNVPGIKTSVYGKIRDMIKIE